MGKNKAKRFQENDSFVNMVQPRFEDVFGREHPLKGHWREEVFKNDNPIVLELGCGRGEYTVALGQADPGVNFIGVDIKGARMWRGAKTATEAGMRNVAFLRTRIEFIDSLFGENEVDEIWITFPDPQLKKQRSKKRLTSPLFLESYAKILKPSAPVNLKTDSAHLYNYTMAVIGENSLPVDIANPDIYGSGFANDALTIKTAYEERFLKQGVPITYIRFRLAGKRQFTTPDFADDDKPGIDKQPYRTKI